MDVCAAIKSFFQEGKMRKQINHTLTALIAEVNNPAATNNFNRLVYAIAYTKSFMKF